MNKYLKIICAILIISVILTAIIIPSIYGKDFGYNFSHDVIDVKWYYDSSDGQQEVTIPSKLDINKGETCTIYGYVDANEMTAATLVIRTSYQKLDVFVEGENIYTYDTDEYRPYGKGDPSKIHRISLPNDIDGKRISISITSPYDNYSGYFSKLEIGDYNNLINNIFSQYYSEFIFGLLIILLVVFLFFSNVLVFKINSNYKGLYYIFGASLFLGSWLVFDSKLINLFMNDFLVGQFVYISLHGFAIMFALFIDAEKTNKIKFISSFIVFVSIINMVVQLLLQVLNIIDYVEMLPITLVLILVELVIYIINKLIRNYQKKKTSVNDKVEAIVGFALLGCFVVDAYLLTYTFYNINNILGLLFLLLAIITHDKDIYKLSEKAQKSNELKARLSQTQNYLIQSQMKPHFIFNTLGAIRTMIKSSPDKAYKLTTAFSKYLRANINNISPTETVSFATEMDHIRTYVDIEKERFDKRLTVLYDIKCDNFNMPPLTVEPLVENAVKHGVCKKVKGGTVKISSWEEEDKYIVTVEDDGVGFDVSVIEQDNESDSVGLKYIRLRLKELSNADFHIESTKGVGTKATLTFYKESVEKK